MTDAQLGIEIIDVGPRDGLQGEAEVGYRHEGRIHP